MLSPMTSAWLYFLMANPGGGYPSVLKNFQWSVLNKCDQVTRTTRDIVMVKPIEKIWTDEELLVGLGEKVEANFLKSVELTQKPDIS